MFAEQINLDLSPDELLYHFPLMIQQLPVESLYFPQVQELFGS